MLIYIAVIWLTCGLWAFTHELRSGGLDEMLRDSWEEQGNPYAPPAWAVALSRTMALGIFLVFGPIAARVVCRDYEEED